MFRGAKDAPAVCFVGAMKISTVCLKTVGDNLLVVFCKQEANQSSKMGGWSRRLAFRSGWQRMSGNLAPLTDFCIPGDAGFGSSVFYWYFRNVAWTSFPHGFTRSGVQFPSFCARGSSIEQVSFLSESDQHA